VKVWEGRQSKNVEFGMDLTNKKRMKLTNVKGGREGLRIEQEFHHPSVIIGEYDADTHFKESERHNPNTQQQREEKRGTGSIYTIVMS
jgi:hypothetical protein